MKSLKVTTKGEEKKKKFYFTRFRSANWN